MNKKVLFTALLAVATTFGVSAQKLITGNLDFLKIETKLNIVFDYSELGEGGDWDKPNFHSDFIRELNGRLTGKVRLKAGNFEDAKYQATVRILSTHLGEFVPPFWQANKPELDIEIVFTEIITAKVLAITSKFNVKGNAMTPITDSRISSVFEEAGEALGKFILKKTK
ncbi:MAG: hypothetical protein LBN27_00200 [Prevotellaceae bacterium]|jgi:hypothetical protein|nr:hypothetical protein [Prevotellaceae bacterium]